MYEKVSLSGLKDLGWTASMVRDLLPDPKLVPNPHYKKAAPMKLWDRALVDSIMATNEYEAALARISKRRSASLRTVKTKTDELTEKALEMANTVYICIASEKKLGQRVLNAKSQWYSSKGIYDGLVGVDDATIERWTVNYIRHRLVNYDKCLKSFLGKVGKTSAYYVFKKRLLERIAEAYPLHAEECYRQVAAMESMTGE